jgi:hypothetical protein
MEEQRRAGLLDYLGIVHGIPWQALSNATYSASLGSEMTVTLRGGVWYREFANPPADWPENVLLLDEMAWGDLNGDGASEAAVVLSIWGGGTGAFRSLHVMGQLNGALRELATADLGDRTAIQAVRIRQKQVIVEVVDHEADEWYGACCPTHSTEYRFVLEGGRLVLRDE